MPVTPHPPNLLYFSTSDCDTSEVLYPWEQSVALRSRLDDHVCACSDCMMRTLPIFGADMTRTVFEARCSEGSKMYDDLRAAAVARRNKVKQDA